MGKAARSRTRSPRRAPQSAKACMALLFDSFFFVPAHAKKKRMGQMFFVLSIGCTWILLVGVGAVDDPKRIIKKLFLLSRFSLTKSAAKVIKEGFPLSLKSLPCRLAATGANKVPRPSRHSLATATGSKRSSADSDLLLCHVRLRQTSRFRFGCVSGCEHSEMGFVSAIYCSNTSSVAVNRATFSHWRRLTRC